MSLISICFAVYENEGSLNVLYDKIISELQKNFPNDESPLWNAFKNNKSNSSY